MQHRWTAPWRSKLGASRAGGITAAFACGLIVAAVIVDGPSGDRIFVAVAMVPVAILGARICVGAHTAALTVSSNGVDIVGLLRSRHVPLADVDAFVVSTFNTSGVFLAPVRGRRYMLWVTSRGVTASATKRTRASLATLCGELNAALVDARAASQST